jgi:hypothetical protein
MCNVNARGYEAGVLVHYAATVTVVVTIARTCLHDVQYLMT